MKHPFRNCTVAIIFSFLLSFTGCQSKEADLQTEKLDSQPEKSNPDTDFSPDFWLFRGNGGLKTATTPVFI
ncbi:MAG: nuclear pore complex Nup192/Nup205 family protein [Lachnospiraceae bacterium]|nr:nuclear pore complex Nup192/Nup205 family protein [Lachnospiraceae bacterium]